MAREATAVGETVSRRTAQHRAAGRARAGSCGQLHIDPNPRRRARNNFPRFDDNARVLGEAYRSLADDVRTGQFVTAAAEWLLDNFHLVASEIRDIHRHLPASYYRQLPTLASREQAGHTRIYAMAVELLRHSDSRIDRQQLAGVHQQLPARRPADDRRALGVAQHAEAGAHRKPQASGRSNPGVAPRANDGRRVRRAGRARKRRRAAPCRRPSRSGRSSSSCTGFASTASVCRRSAPRSRSISRCSETTAEAAIRGEHQRQAADQVSVANAITGLRLCSAIDWRQYVESVSLVEQVLQRDPAGAYGRMDFLSRDRQRQAVEELAAPSGEAQVGSRCEPLKARARPWPAERARSGRPCRLPPDRPGAS